ncbi:response regulator transcription factor [bacterium]|nr:response regulator transcription factor [bacterium]
MSIRILLADDHKIFLKRMRSLLDKEPNIDVVGGAGNGKDAVKLALKIMPDIVVMDISMPELNGINATQEINKRMPHTKVLCLTVHSERHFVLAMFRAGAAGYVLKDCPFEELSRAISVVHSGKKYVCRQIAHYITDKSAPQASSNNEESGR